MEKTENKIKPHDKEKIDRHDYMLAWSTGMNDYEIAKKLGVSIKTVKTVKNDLKKSGNGRKTASKQLF